jgi:hypothetical protein
MSEEQPPGSYSHPTSSGGLFLRVVLVALALAAIGGVIWYMNK